MIFTDRITNEITYRIFWRNHQLEISMEYFVSAFVGIYNFDGINDKMEITNESFTDDSVRPCGYREKNYYMKLPMVKLFICETIYYFYLKFHNIFIIIFLPFSPQFIKILLLEWYVYPVRKFTQFINSYHFTYWFYFLIMSRIY